MPDEEISQDVLQFILEQIDSVPHLEALLLFWERPARAWSVEEMSSALYVAPHSGRAILADLERRKLIRAVEASSGNYAYDPAWDNGGGLMARVAVTYRTRLVPVSTIIHSKGSQAMRDFARAFVFKKDS